jgi:predicted AlkP superfamily phosphohydrolase/phosphomutase
MTERLLIVGWDGADWAILDDLIARGTLPHLAEMVRDGARGVLMSPIPAHSWAAWPTFLTGMDPGGHGVFDFMERHGNRLGKRLPVLSSAIRAPTFLEQLSDDGREVRAGNVPVTFPPIPVRGRMISGGAIPPGSPFILPQDWAEELESVAPFPLNGMEWTRHRLQPRALIDEAVSFVSQRTASFEALLEGSWDVAVCVYVVTDRLQHPFGDYLLPSHPAYADRSETEIGGAIRDVYRLLDAQLPRLWDAAGPDSTLILVSDHGFEPVTRASDTNAVLIRQGMAAASVTGEASRSFSRSPLWRSVAHTGLGRLIRRRIPTPPLLNWSKTLAYDSVTGGGVSINLKGREPDGVVHERDYERIRDEVREALLSFEDDDLGKPIAEVLRGEDVFSGDFVHLGPDLIALPNPMWVLDHTDLAATRLDYPTADHRREGVLVAAGGPDCSGDLGKRGLADIAATVLAFCELPFAGLDGVPIEEITGGRAARQAGDPSQRIPAREEVALSDAETEAITQHLRDLGYIE